MFRVLALVTVKRTSGLCCRLSSNVSSSASLETQVMASNLSALPERVPRRSELFSLYPTAEGAVVRQAWIEDLVLNEDAPQEPHQALVGDGMDDVERKDSEVENGAEEETEDKKSREETWKRSREETLNRSPEDLFVSLHPEVWSVRPRIDTIQKNVDWQLRYKTVSYKHAKTRYELPPSYTGRPWPQKGMGRARHSTIRSPLWNDGGSARGPRSPRSFFFMLPYQLRVNGLVHTLATKFAQDDVHFVRDLDIPSRDPDYVERLIDQRGYGMSALLVDAKDEFPENITAATEKISHVNLMPVYGLNVHSMLKHKTLILTLDALNLLESKLLFALHRTDKADINHKSVNPKIM